MAEQDKQHGSENPAGGATHSKQTTRFQYPRGDAVIGEFFASNVYKSAALIDVIYLFHLDYGASADVSQILRERLMAVRSNNSNGGNNAVPTPPATKRTVDMPSNTESDAVSHEAAEKQTQQKAESEQPEKQHDTVTEDSNTDKKSSDFDIAEMFD